MLVNESSIRNTWTHDALSQKRRDWFLPRFHHDFSEVVALTYTRRRHCLMLIWQLLSLFFSQMQLA